MTAGTATDEMVFWIDGRIVSRTEQVLRPDDHALVGDVFEAIKLLGGKPFALTRHLDRLAASAVPLGLPVDLDAVRGAVAEILTTEQAGVPNVDESRRSSDRDCRRAAIEVRTRTADSSCDGCVGSELRD